MTVVSDDVTDFVTEIYIDADLLDIESDKIMIFALDIRTLGLSNNPPQLWTENSLWKTEVKVIKDGKELLSSFHQKWYVFIDQKNLN